MGVTWAVPKACSPVFGLRGGVVRFGAPQVGEDLTQRVFANADLVTQQVEGGSPAAAAARRLIIARTSRRDSARPVSRRAAGSTLWKSAELLDGVG